MNKVTMLAALASGAAMLPASASAQASETVFSCALDSGRTVTVTRRGNDFTYRYGTPRRAELTLTGNAGSGNLHFMRQRYAGPQMQLRFSNGAYSYIVHAMEGNGNVGANGVSGLVVMRGNQRVADHACRRYTDFSAGFDQLDALPEDSEAYTAM